MEKHADNTAYLNPPDNTPEYSLCDECGGTFCTQDLTKVKDLSQANKSAWLCPACIEDGEPAKATE